MADAIERLIFEAVRTAVRESVPDIGPAVAAALKHAGAAHEGGAAVVYVPVKEAARLMSAHPATVRKLIADGKLCRFSVEGQLRVRVSDLHAYMARESDGAATVSVDDRAREILGQGKRSFAR